MAARAIDTMNEVTKRDNVRDALFNYLDTDTIWYGTPLLTNHTYSPDTWLASFHQSDPEPLVRLQKEYWDPLLTWARDTFDVELLTSDSLLFNSQPEATKQKLEKVLQGLDPWQMAGCVSFIVLSRLPLIFCGQRWSA